MLLWTHKPADYRPTQPPFPLPSKALCFVLALLPRLKHFQYWEVFHVELQTFSFLYAQVQYVQDVHDHVPPVQRCLYRSRSQTRLPSFFVPRAVPKFRYRIRGFLRAAEWRNFNIKASRSTSSALLPNFLGRVPLLKQGSLYFPFWRF